MLTAPYLPVAIDVFDIGGTFQRIKNTADRYSTITRVDLVSDSKNELKVLQYQMVGGSLVVAQSDTFSEATSSFQQVEYFGGRFVDDPRVFGDADHNFQIEFLVGADYFFSNATASTVVNGGKGNDRLIAGPDYQGGCIARGGFGDDEIRGPANTLRLSVLGNVDQDFIRLGVSFHS